MNPRDERGRSRGEVIPAFPACPTAQLDWRKALTDMLAMRRLLVISALLLTAAVAQAEEPSVLAPYRFPPPAQTLSPAEQQRARTYRSQLQNQLNHLERQRATGRLTPREENRLQDTHRELDRMDRILQPEPHLPRSRVE